MSENFHPVEWLSAYYDGELEPVRRGQVEAHLGGCDDCRRELAALEALSQALSRDQAADAALTDQAAFWRKLEPRLTDRAPASVNPSEQKLPLRWLPGLGLLALNGLWQAGALVAVAVMLVAPWLPPVVPWLSRLDRLAAVPSLGWLGWLLPREWIGVGLWASFVVVSGGLAVLYVAWLGYEMRYGKQSLAPAGA